MENRVNESFLLFFTLITSFILGYIDLLLVLSDLSDFLQSGIWFGKSFYTALPILIGFTASVVFLVYIYKKVSPKWIITRFFIFTMTVLALIATFLILNKIYEGFHHWRLQQEYQNEADINYRKIKNELVSPVTITKMDIDPIDSLATNKGFSILLPVPDNFGLLNRSGFLDYKEFVEKNVIGHEVQVIMPDIKSSIHTFPMGGSYPPVTFHIGLNTLVCRCDVLFNGESLTKIYESYRK